jgi:hypothetical protein
MANEIRVSLTLQLSNGTLAPGAWNETGSFTQNTALQVANVVATSTTYAALAVGGIATNGWTLFKNLDATNNLDLGYDDAGTFRAFATLKPGEFAAIRLKSGVIPAAKAAAGNPKLAYWIVND